jgi:hypothetical protein
MSHESINTIRACHSNQCCNRFVKGNEPLFRSGTRPLFAIWDFSPTSIPLHQNSSKSKQANCDSRAQESFYYQTAFRHHRTNSSECAAKWKEHQRYCCRSAATFFIKEVNACRSAMNFHMRWCLNINSIDFTNSNLRMSMRY